MKNLPSQNIGQRRNPVFGQYFVSDTSHIIVIK